uniref:Uncharacterized protein n=1 Tax=Arundo donax TaxID=35708 RepID=A0A0A8Z8I0_ARUDO
MDNKRQYCSRFFTRYCDFVDSTCALPDLYIIFS